MDATSNSIRGGPRRRRATRAAAICMAACWAHSGLGATSLVAEKYTSAGSALITLDARAQQGGSFVLRGTLASSDAALAASPPVQDSANYALIAKLAPKPTVCYNDTIFRNDFDGDGF